MPALQDGQHYQGQRFTDLRMLGEQVSGVEFDACVFEGGIFTESTFSRCRFSDTRFRRCDLSVVKLPGCFVAGVRFVQCKMIGLDWTVAAPLQAATAMLSAQFEECVLDYSNFFGLKLRNLQLVRCSAKEADFTEADLSGVDCRGTDFSGARFSHTILERADLRDALNYTINPAANRMRGARVSLPEAVMLLRAFEIEVEGL